MPNYHYTECGLQNVYLLNGFEITNGEVFIHDVHGLHKEIGLALIYKRGVLIGDEVKFIRTTMDLSQRKLGELLGLDYQTILAYEKNKNMVTKTSDRLLKTIFFSYLEENKSDGIYALINTIADLEDLDTEDTEQTIQFEEDENKWKMVA